MSICKRGHKIEYTPGSDSCKHCKREFYIANKSNILEKSRKSYAENPSFFLKKNKVWSAANPSSMRKARAKWADNHPAQSLACTRVQQSKRLLRCPKWITKEHKSIMSEKYAQARAMTQETGIPHEVDHEIPLLGEKVSGLHVPWNLSVITASANMSKGNRVQI